MSFNAIPTRVPSSIGDITISVRQSPGGEIMALYDVQVLDQDGNVMHIERGDLLSIADEQSQVTIGAEVAGLRAKAEAELL